LKRAMAGALVARLHDDEAAHEAEARFDRLHVQRELPDEIPDHALTANGDVVHMPAVLRDVFGLSSSEGRRLLAQGGVKLNGEALGGNDLDLPPARLDGAVLQVGKRRFVRLQLG